MHLIRRTLSNLSLDFGLLLILAALVSILSLLGLKQVDADYRRLVNDSFEIERIAANTKTNLLEAIHQKDNFLLTLETEGFETASATYIEPHNRHIDSLTTDLSRLSALVSNKSEPDYKQIQKDVAQMLTALDVYKKDFAALLALLQKRGTAQEGLEGQFRTQANKMEALIQGQNTPQAMQIALLKLRLFEQNYLLEGTATRAAPVNRHYLTLCGRAEDAAHSRLVKTDLAYTLDSSITDSTDVVEIDEQLLALEQSVGAPANTINTLANNIDAAAQHQAATQLSNAQFVSSQTISLVTMSVVVILIFGLGLTLVIVYRLQSKSKTGS